MKRGVTLSVYFVTGCVGGGGGMCAHARVCACACVTARFLSSFCEHIMAPKFTFLHWISYQHKSEILTERTDPKIATERT
jgi:hypothetical protein